MREQITSWKSSGIQAKDVIAKRQTKPKATGRGGRVRACLAKPVLHEQDVIQPKNGRAELGGSCLIHKRRPFFLVQN